MGERRTTCPVGSAKQMVAFFALIQSRAMEILGPVCAGALLQKDLHPNGSMCSLACPYLPFSSSKHVEWGKTLTASDFCFLESQEKVQFLVNHQTKEQRTRKQNRFRN